MSGTNSSDSGRPPAFTGKDAEELGRAFWNGVITISGFDLRRMFEHLRYDDEALERLAKRFRRHPRTITRWITGDDGPALSGLVELAFELDVLPFPPPRERIAWGWMSAVQVARGKLVANEKLPHQHGLAEIRRYDFECLRQSAPVFWEAELHPEDTAQQLHERIRQSIYKPVWDYYCADAPRHGSAEYMKEVQSKWGVAWAWTRATLNDLNRDESMR